MGKDGDRATKTVSLSNELHLMMSAIEGVHRLTRHWIDNFGMDLDDVPESISALLVVLVGRLRLLDRVARRTIDPRFAWSPENDATVSPGDPPGDPEEDDVRLVAWSDRELLRHHRAEWKRAKRRLALAKRRTSQNPSEFVKP